MCGCMTGRETDPDTQEREEARNNEEKCWEAVKQRAGKQVGHGQIHTLFLKFTSPKIWLMVTHYVGPVRIYLTFDTVILTEHSGHQCHLGMEKTKRVRN